MGEADAFMRMLHSRRDHSPANELHRVRAYVLEQATFLEFAINEVLAARLATNIHGDHELTFNV